MAPVPVAGDALLLSHGPLLEAPLAFEHDLGPGVDFSGGGGGGCTIAGARALPHDLGQDFHPALLVGAVVGVEIDHFAVGEADPEAFFHKHIAFLFLGEGGFPPATALGAGLFLGER